MEVFSVFYQTALKDIMEQRKANKNGTNGTLNTTSALKPDDAMRLIIDSALDAVICMDITGIIRIWNPTAEKIFGWKETEVQGKLLSEVVIPEQYREQHRKGLQHYLHTGESKVLNKLMEITATNRDGHEFPVELTIVPIQQAGKEFFCGFVRDISERRRVENELRQSELKYRSIIDHASDAIMITDMTGVFKDVNVSLCKMFGYERGDLIGKNIAMLIDPDQLHTDPMRFDVLKSGKSVMRERRMRHRDGTIIEVEANVKMLPDGRALAIARDVTQRKLADKVLRESENRFRTIFETEPECVKLLDNECHLLDMNPAGLGIIDVADVNLVKGHDVLPLVNEKYKIAFREMVNKVFQGESCLLEFEITSMKGRVRLMEMHAVPIYDSNKKIVSLLSVSRDITERKLAEEQIKLSTEQLRQLSSHLQTVREEERTAIAREIHDELGQQLTGLKMDISWLNKRIAQENEPVREKIANMISLVDDTVKTIRRISTELRPGILDDLGLTDALDWQSTEFEKRTGIRCRFKSATSELSFNKNISTGIFRVYQETLTNVARHAEATEIKTTLESGNGNLTLRVCDNGKGFDEAEIKSKKTFGLVGMAERANMFGGKLAIESEKGRGTVIILKVPLTKLA